MGEGTDLPDRAARKTALTAIDRSLLVEAGAGSGKTAILAGRVAILLAQGVAPKNIAAITFTEFAASELRIRIEQFVNALAARQVPKELEIAFPGGVLPEEEDHLRKAREHFDHLTCSTIHGFAQALIKPYPVEADIDPGASIIDPAEADLAFGEHVEAWLKEHLSGATKDDILAELVLAGEGRSLKAIGELTEFLRRNRTAQPADGRWNKAAVTNFNRALASLRRHLDGVGFREAETDELLDGYALIGSELAAFDVAHDSPSAESLFGVLGLPAPPGRQLRKKGKWQAAARAARRPKEDGEAAHERAAECCESCLTAYEALVTVAAGEILARLFEAMTGLMLKWRDYKRAAALLDFDDLLHTARDLLAQHPAVRQALAQRYRHVLVDEFQDTDPLQIEILWRLCGDPPSASDKKLLSWKMKPGALFLVGDPKQAIYRFRGADVNAYLAAREAIGAHATLEITANFRSLEPIIKFVNNKFSAPLAKDHGQPGFTALLATAKAPKHAVTVAAVDVDDGSDEPSAEKFRDAEASCVAELCRRVIANWKVRDPDNNVWRPCRAGDIALLAPVGTELWRFEEALEDEGIAVSTQAGKGFFRRQEIQDLIALTRVIADGRDSLALGAILRGPLVGLSEVQLLDIAEALPSDGKRLPNLTLWTEPVHVANELARTVLEKVQRLARRARSTTPYMLLSEALDSLAVRPQLRQRYRTGAERPIANVDLYLEMARAYDVRGLRAFARDMRANWNDAVRQVEGRPDAAQDAVSLITIHAAKGLEWPIVIPINMTGSPRRETSVMFSRSEATFSTRLLGIAPPAYNALQTLNDEEQARERVRLWYVATTRARDLLLLPRHSASLPERAWGKIIDLDLASLPTFDGDRLPLRELGSPETAENRQTKEIFAAEAGRIAAAKAKVTWVQPSRAEIDAPQQPDETRIYSIPQKTEEPTAPLTEVAGSTARGLILHKLIEELLSGELQGDTPEIEWRTLELLNQLGIKPVDDAKVGISPAEIAETVIRTLRLPEIERLALRLVPEHTVFGHRMAPDGEMLISGIADAIAPDDQGGIDAVIDWKSDVSPSPEAIDHYRKQINEYRRTVGAKRALLVFVTQSKVIEMT
jgi:exodeoxyribonuclease-5